MDIFENEGVYVLHFDAPVKADGKYDWNEYRFGDKLHYVGVTRDFDERETRHRFGGGSVITKAAYEQRIDFKVGYFYSTKFNLAAEDYFRKNCTYYCTICHPWIISTESAKIVTKIRAVNGIQAHAKIFMKRPVFRRNGRRAGSRMRTR